MSDLIGKTLGKYQIVVRVGRGGMARVYKAYQASLDRYVAVKVLHKHLAEEGDFIQRFEREATAVARLRHPNIVQVYDYDVQDELYFIVMEFVEGPTLKAELNERMKLRENDDDPIFGPAEIVPFLATLADAIDYAHSRGMIHRDLKPGNIMFTAEGQILLTDFGLARMAFSSHQTRTGALSGTPAYMAPEQVEGHRVDERSDVYALGIVMYEMMCGRVPFQADTGYAVMTQHVTEPVPSPRQYNSSIPEDVEPVLLRALKKDPDERYQSAGAFSGALRESLEVSYTSIVGGAKIAPIATLVDSQEVMSVAASQLGFSISSQAAIESPYRGLYAFREEDAPYFFGRELFIERLVQTMEDQSMAAVIGPSGSGKSSVVFAGLLPNLRESGKWKIIETRPGSRPFYSLANALVDSLDPDVSETERLLEARQLATALSQGELELPDVLERIARRNGNGKRPLLVVDQFEELYTLCTDEQVRHRFPNCLFKAISASHDREDFDFSLVLTLRADFMGQALADRPFADALQDADVKLGPMTRAELGRAVESPAGKMDVAFEAGLVDRILDDVGGEPGNLPLLEFALSLLWDRRTGRRLTHAAYDTIGRVEGSLARYADEIYEELDAEAKRRARRIFTQMVRPGEGTEDTRRLAGRDELGEEDWALAQRLADARLVVTGRTPDGHETVEVVHEALIRGWGRLQTWMNAERAFRAWQERMRVSLRQWENSDRDDGALLRGVPLGEAEEWRERQGKNFSDAEGYYIQASINLREEQEAEREARRQRELEAAQQLAEEQQRLAESEHQRADDQARSTRRLRGFALVLAAVFLIAVAAAILAVGQRQDAVQQADARATEVVVRRTAEASAVDSASLAATRAAESVSARVTAEAERVRADDAADIAIEAKDEAEAERDRADAQADLALSRQLAAQATTLFGPQLDLALLLGLEANNINDSADTRSSILAGLQANPALNTYLRGHVSLLQSIDFSPDGKLVATAGAEGVVLLWDLATGEQLGSFEGHDPGQLVNRVDFSPDGKTLATVSDDLVLIIWDVETRQELHRLTDHTAWVQGVAFSPDGDRLASVGGDRNVFLWDSATGEVVDTFSGHNGPIWDVRFSPDGQFIGTGSGDNNAIIWDAATGEILHTLTGHTAVVFGVGFSPDSQTMVTGSADGNMILWDVETGEQIGDPFVGNAAQVISVAFSPDGQTIASAGGDSTVRLWDSDSHQQTQFFGNHNAAVNVVTFSPDGQLLASGDGVGTMILWNALPNDRPLWQLLAGHDGGAAAVDFNPESGILASAGADSRIRFWDPVTAFEVGRPITHGLRITEPVSALALSPDAERLASGSSNGTIIIWDVSSSRAITMPISALVNGITSLAFAPDGQSIAAGGPTGFTSIWNVQTGLQIGPFLAGHTAPVGTLTFSPDQQLVASGSADGTVIIRPISEVQSGLPLGRPLTYTQEISVSVTASAFNPTSEVLATGDSQGLVVLWDVETRTPLSPALPSHDVGVASLAFSPDSSVLAVASVDGLVSLWEMETMEPIGRPLEGLAAGASHLAFSENGNLLIGAGIDGTAIIWDFASGDVVDVTQVTDTDGAMALNQNGGFVAYGSGAGTVGVYELPSGEIVGQPLTHEAPFLANVFDVAFSPDGSILASAGADSSIVLWDVASREPIGQPLLGHGAQVVNLAFSPDGSLLASGSCSQFHTAGNCIGGEITIWDVDRRQPVRTLRNTVGFSQGLAFSPDGHTLVSNDCGQVEAAGVCLEGLIAVWDVDSGERLDTLSGHSQYVWSLAFSPDGKTLASASADNTIILWDFETGQPIGPRLTNHGGPVRRLVFNGDGSLLASVGFDNIVYLWDTETGQALGGPFTVHTGNVVDVIFSPNSDQMATASADGDVILWDVDFESWRDLACRIVNRNLRAEEWQQFFGDIPYQETCQEG